jgi:hypothetical protein
MNHEQSVPSLITLNEFCVTIGLKKTYPSESLGGFAYYCKKHGVPIKWPYNMWFDLFQKYLNEKK